MLLWCIVFSSYTFLWTFWTSLICMDVKISLHQKVNLPLNFSFTQSFCSILVFLSAVAGVTKLEPVGQIACCFSFVNKVSLEQSQAYLWIICGCFCSIRAAMNNRQWQTPHGLKAWSSYCLALYRIICSPLTCGKNNWDSVNYSRTIQQTNVHRCLNVPGTRNYSMCWGYKTWPFSPPNRNNNNNNNKLLFWPSRNSDFNRGSEKIFLEGYHSTG